MHYAVDSANCECIKTLINLGADPSAKDKQGKTAFDLSYDEAVQIALRVTPVLDDPSELIAGSFIYPASDGIPSPNATNFISEIGEEPGLFDTFGIDKFHKVLKESRNLKPIFNWLKEIGLEDLYEILCEAGYDDIKAMVSQMSGPMPITENDLKTIGISKSGHRLRLLLRLEQDAGLLPKISLKKNIESSGFLQCCLVANNATRNLSGTSLIEWLDDLGLGNTHQRFLDVGLESYESLISTLAANKLTSKYLEKNIGILNSEHRMRVLRRLDRDLNKFYTATSNISFDEPKTVACDSCGIF